MLMSAHRRSRQSFRNAAAIAAITCFSVGADASIAPGFPAHAVTTAELDGQEALEVVAGSWALESGQIRAWTIVDADCPGDVDGDGIVGAADMAALLAAWGPCPGMDCPADADGDGQVTITDLITLLGEWGPC